MNNQDDGKISLIEYSQLMLPTEFVSKYFKNKIINNNKTTTTKVASAAASASV